jgi:hypothetical protein
MHICGHNASRMISPITQAVVSEDGRGTSARIETVEAGARGDAVSRAERRCPLLAAKRKLFSF